MKKLVYLAFIALLFSACAKDGEDGKDGATGNANIQAFNFSTTPGSWITNGTAGQYDHYKFVEFPVASITQSIMDDGMVLVYLNEAGYNVALPIVLPVSSTQYLNLYTGVTIGKVEVDLQLNTLQTPNSSGINWNFKVVVASGLARISHPEINWKDYNQVARTFNL